MSSRFIHIIVRVRIAFPFKAESYSIVWMNHILFICSAVNGHLGDFHLLAAVSNAALKMGVQVSLQISAFSSFLGVEPGVELLVILCSVF